MNRITITEYDNMWYAERGKYWGWADTIEDALDRIKNTYPPVTLR